MNFLSCLARSHARLIFFVLGVLALPLANAGQGYCTTGATGAASKCNFSSRDAAAAWSYTTSIQAQYPEWSDAGAMFDGEGPSGWWAGLYYTAAGQTRTGPWRMYAITEAMCRVGERYFDDVRACVQVDSVPPKPGNNPDLLGESCPRCGKPINPGTGNMWHDEIDYASASPDGLQVRRTYNSSPDNWDGGAIHRFGTPWTSMYDANIAVTATFEPNQPRGQCWRRIDTMQQWCEDPLLYDLTKPALRSAVPAAILLSRGNGKKFLFKQLMGVWVSDADNSARLTTRLSADSSHVEEWTYVTADADTTEAFDADGRLISVKSRSGMSKRLTYGDGVTNDTALARIPANAPVCSRIAPGVALKQGVLLCVTDNWGQQLNFEYDLAGRIAKVIDPAQQAIQYTYDGAAGGCLEGQHTGNCWANNLASVTYPGGAKRLYHYNEAARINGGAACPGAAPVGSGYGSLLNALTGLTDENGQRHISWTYDCTGKATSSEVGSGTEKVVLAYGVVAANGASATTVTHFLGDNAHPTSTVRQYAYQPQGASLRSTTMDLPCIECGSFAMRGYDANGNLNATTDWNGAVTKMSYDLVRNLETKRTEAFGTPQARITTTQWHPTFRLPAKIAEPKRITTMQYDANGNLTSRTMQATADVDGAQGLAAAVTGLPQAITFTYNQFGQVKTVDGPRTDVVDVSTFNYDGSGNLWTLLNAAGHTTTISNYDAHGRAGKIADANGVTTELHYNPRGWLTSKTVKGSGGPALITLYEYDDVGQIKRVTMPDQSVVLYSYDDAHRLTDIADKLGNTIHYTLDNVGNRTAETVTDPTGALKRQIARVFDTMSRLKQVTGGTQ